MTRRGTIFRATYSVRGNELLFHIYGRDEQGKRIAETLTGTVPYFYVLEEEAAKARTLTHLGVVNVVSGPLTVGGRRTARVECRFPFDVPKAKREFSWTGEADILYSIRQRVDHGLTHVELPDPTGASIPVGSVVSLATPPVLNPRILTIDIEVNDHGGYGRPNDPFQPVLSVAHHDSGTNRFVVAYRGPPVDPEAVRAKLVAHVPEAHREAVRDLLDAEIRLVPTETEVDLLGAVGQLLGRIEPDFVSAWNGNEYDYPYLGARTQRILAAHPGDPDLMRLFESFDVDRDGGGDRYHGVQRNRGRYALLDPMKSLEKLEMKQAAYSLEAVAQRTLKFGKIPRPDLVADLYRSDLVAFLAYNLFDVLLTVAIDRKRGLTTFMRAIAEAANVEVQDAYVGNSRIVDGALLTEARITGTVEMVFPSKEFAPGTKEKGKGAIVFPPDIGTHEWVVVLDLSAMYPSLIVSANISFDTMGSADPDAIHLSYEDRPGGSYRRAPLGLLPRAIQRLWAVRNEVKHRIKTLAVGSPERREAEAMSTGLKFCVNSFFGVTGSGHWRLANSQIFNDITGMGRAQLRFNRLKVEDPAWLLSATGRRLTCRVLYGDTDSVMLVFRDADTNDVVREPAVVLDIAKKVRTAFNQSYAEFFAPFGITEHVSDIGIEGIFETFKLLPLADSDGEEGAKKRYFGLYAFVDEQDVRNAPYDDRLKVRGVEMRRFNVADLTRTVQGGIIRRTVERVPIADIRTYIEAERVAVLGGERDDALFVQTKLGKDFVLYGHQTRRRTTDGGEAEAYVVDTKKPPFVRAMENYARLTGKVVNVGDAFRWVYVTGGVRYKDTHEPDLREFAVPIRMSLVEAREAGFRFDIDRERMVQTALLDPARLVFPEWDAPTTANLADEW